MSSTWGKNLKISIFGESHGECIGVIIDGLPAGEKIDLEQIHIQMNRRKPGKSRIESQRNESDLPKILSGVLNNCTTGAPVCAIIENKNAKSSDYEDISSIARPGHADLTNHIKYKGYNDLRGGGHSSGRLTAPMVFAGAICRQILSRKGIDICAHIYSIGNIYDEPFDKCNIPKSLMNDLFNSSFSVINQNIKYKMINKIDDIRSQKDSIGGSIECCISGVNPGIGGPIFDGIENVISSIIFGIPGVKGIEFGSGFNCTNMLGSQHNDEFAIHNEYIYTKTNNHGGILGGISSGMPIVFRVAIKPTPSIGVPQHTIDIKKTQEVIASISGRHDPCIVPRAVPVIEAAASLAIMDLIMSE